MAASPRIIKSALRDWLSISYGMISILLIGSLRSPPPIRLRPWTHLRCEGSQGSEGSKGSEGDGIALWAMSIKSALRDLLSVSYDIVSILVISRYAAPPYPAAPDFLHGKACHTILRSLCSLTNRVPLPPHPGDRINRSMLSCRDMAPWLSIHSPTTKWGEGGGASHQRGMHFQRPQGGCMVFAAPGSGI